MRTLCVGLLVSVLLTANAAAQSTDTLALAPMRAPGSPAFAILGIEPSAVQRPATPRAVALNLFSAASQSTLLPDSYALEVAPYWLSPRPDITYDEYFAGSGRHAWVQTFAISLATSRTPMEAADSGTSIGVGLRVVPFRGRPSKAALALDSQLDTALLRKADLNARRIPLQDDLAEAQQALVNATTDAQISHATQRIAQLKSILELLDAEWQMHVDTIAKLAEGLDENDRVGPVLEIALAGAALYPSDNFDSGQLSRAGLWATFGYRLENPAVDLLMLARYQLNKAGTEQNLVDVGGRVIMKRQLLSLSGEFVSRTAIDVDGDDDTTSGTFEFASSSRATVLAEFRLNDDMYLFGGFGRDFERASDDTHPLFAAFGIQLNWGNKPKLTL